MNRKDFEDRFAAFALRVAKLAESLSETLTARTIANQIVRSGFSVAANYRAAGRARSKPDFISKIGIAEEEADETLFWLQMIVKADLMPEKKLNALLKEAEEIVAILATTRKNARTK